MMGLLSNAVGGVKLQVEKADLERAAEILGAGHGRRRRFYRQDQRCRALDLPPMRRGSRAYVRRLLVLRSLSRDGTVDPTFEADGHSDDEKEGS